MPIKVDSTIRVFDEDEFHELAYKIIGVAFEVHRQLGRLMEEDVYKRVICEQCARAGLAVARREVEIKVTFKDFAKSYFMDLLFNCGLMVEAKTAERLSDSHHSQTLHYLLLSGMRHGLLMNFRPSKVQKRFVSTTLNLSQRRMIHVHDADWLPNDQSGQRLRDLFLAMLNDWGAFLQLSLYREALVHFFGGSSSVRRRIPIIYQGKESGSHEVCMIAEATAMALTGLKDGQSKMRIQLQRFLQHTRLSRIQWINMNNHDIEFRTLTNGATSTARDK